MALFPWILFAFMTVVGATIFNICIKIATNGHIHSNLFSAIFAVVGVAGNVAIILLYKYWIAPDVKIHMDSTGLWAAIIAGIAGIMINVFYFLAIQHGSAVNSQAVWTVGGLIAVTLAMVLFFHEPMSMQKTAGIILGIIALLMIVKS
jgi:drug/metabolite transporter (DMT)-like permease